MMSMLVSFSSSTTVTHGGAGIAFSSGALELTLPRFSVVFESLNPGSCVVFCEPVLVFSFFFSIGHCIVCHKSIYIFSLYVWLLSYTTNFPQKEKKIHYKNKKKKRELQCISKSSDLFSV